MARGLAAQLVGPRLRGGGAAGEVAGDLRREAQEVGSEERIGNESETKKG